MSLSEDGASRTTSVKTLGIRFEPKLHAELTLVAQLREQTIADEIREAIEAHIQRIKEDPQWASRADDVLAEIERQATARRDAFARLFRTDQATDQSAAAETEPGDVPATPRTRRRSSSVDS